MKTQKPVNQKTIYHSYADLYEKIMNDEIPLEKGETAVKALDGMNRTYALELRRAEIESELKVSTERIKIRTLELNEFAEIPTEGDKQES